jgi:hypothetical protein
MTAKVAGVDPGQRQLNGPQTTGRDYRNLSAPDFAMTRRKLAAVRDRIGLHKALSSAW